MIYEFLIGLSVALHFVWILFLVFGFVFVLKGARLAWLHLAGLGFALVLNIFHWYCPLTYLEYWLKGTGREQLADNAPFLVRCLEMIIYPNVEESTLRTGVILFVFLNLSAYFFVGWNHFFRKQHKKIRVD